MELTERQKKLLKALSDAGNVATGKNLSAASGIALRTVQAEMSTLRKEGIITSGEHGYQLVNKEVIHTTKEVKNYALIQRLLSTEEGVDFYTLCDEFFVSESTMKQRLKEVNEFLNEGKLSVVMQSGLIRVEGTELKKRKLIRKLIYNDANFNGNFQNIFSDFDFNIFNNIVQSSLAAKGYYIQNPYANSVLVSIMICLYRVQKGIHTPSDYIYDTDTNEYKLAKYIAERFADHYHCEPTESDVCYIANLFQGQIVEQSHIRNEFKADAQFEESIGHILMEVFNEFSVNVEFHSSLHTIALHTYELIRRAQAHNYVISNNYVSMRENCPYIYDIAVHYSRKLDELYHITIPDDEIGFLAVHIGLIIRQANQDDSVVKILLFLSNYHGIADRISNILYANYDQRIAIVRWEPSSGSLPSQNFDLIITTEHLDIIGRDILEITPFYDMIDRANVDAAISKCIKESKHKKEYQALMDCFSPDLFFIQSDIKTSDEAIEFLGHKMIDYGITESGYIESVKDRESLSPTSFFDTFAIPHSIDMDAHQTMFAILINPNGISWNHTSVKLALMIAIKKEDLRDFSNIYDGVVHVLCDAKRFNNLITSTNIQEFMENFRTV